MAVIKHIASGKLYYLPSPAIVGRGPGLSIQTTNRMASNAHAEFRWTGTAWVLRDLGSKNGTFVGSQRLDAGETVPIMVGSHLAFGDTEDRYEVTDLEPPAASAQADDGTVRQAEGGILVLPDDDNPEFTVSEEGPGGWFMEDASGARQRIADQARLHSGGRSWRLDLPVVPEPTLGQGDHVLYLGSLGLRFQVNRSEEHIEITILHRTRAIPLPTRAHCELLLCLGQARRDDNQNPSLSDSERGWVYVEDLLERLGCNEGQLNVSIFRARQQFALAGVKGATALIERRSTARQIRLGVSRVEILSL